jgi:hypothetical protein
MNEGLRNVIRHWGTAGTDRPVIGCIRVNVNSSPCLTEHHTMKAYGGMEVYLHAFLTSALDGGEWSASRPGRFIPKVRTPGTSWVGGCVGPRTGLDPVYGNGVETELQGAVLRIQTEENYNTVCPSVCQAVCMSESMVGSAYKTMRCSWGGGGAVMLDRWTGRT